MSGTKPVAGADHKLKQAKRLLRLAKRARRPLDQRLLVAGAFSSVMSTAPIVVGGTAEEYWTGDEYRPTDLDLIPRPSKEDEFSFQKLDFKKEGRHWVGAQTVVATEFPHDPTFEVRRTFDVQVGGVTVKVIGVDDLYLDRLGQTTMSERTNDQHFASVLAIALTNWEVLDWRYIERRIAETIKLQPTFGLSMRKMNRASRRIARRELAIERAKNI